MIPLTEFAPDLPATTPGIILDARNVQPTPAGFRPLNDTASLGAALPARPIGAFRAYYIDQSTALFAAVENGSTQVDFYRLSGGTWSAVGAGFAHTAGALADFAQYGDDVHCAAALNGGLFRCPKAGSFAAISGSPANTLITTTASLQALAFVGDQWFSSAIGDNTDFTDSAATLARNGRILDTPGPIVAGAFINRNALAFKKNSIYIGQQGAPFGWLWEIISGGSGTWGRGCVIQGPDFVAYIGLDDFWITTGYTPQRIPNNLARWFFRMLDGNHIEETIGWFDASQSTLYWHFVSINAPDAPTCDMFVSYNLRARRWAVGHGDVSSVPYFGITSNQLPLPISTNSSIFIDGSFVPQQRSGDPGPMFLTTGYHGDPARLSQMFGVKPEYNTKPSAATVVPWHVRELGKPDEHTEAAVEDIESGWHTCGQYDRYHKWVLSTQGDCEVIGFTPEFRPGGTY